MRRRRVAGELFRLPLGKRRRWHRGMSDQADVNRDRRPEYPRLRLQVSDDPEGVAPISRSSLSLAFKRSQTPRQVPSVRARSRPGVRRSDQGDQLEIFRRDSRHGIVHVGHWRGRRGDQFIPSGLLVDNVTVSATAVPEPTSVTLCLIGAAGLALRRRRPRGKIRRSFTRHPKGQF